MAVPPLYDPMIAVIQDPRIGFILSGDLKSRYNGLLFPGDGWTNAAKGRITQADSAEYNFMFRGFPKQYSRIHKHDFQPRIGIAYAINPRMVIRSGVSRRGLHTQVETNINQLQPGTLQANPGINADYLRPFRGFGPIRLGSNIGSMRYNGSQIEASRRLGQDRDRTTARSLFLPR